MKIINNKNRFQRTELFVEVSVTLIIFFIALRVPFDTDFFWHLNAGKVSFEQQSVLLSDFFSFTKYGTPWVNHSWLSQIIFYIIYRMFSYPGIMVLVALVATATMSLIYKSMKGNSFVKAFLIILAVLISAVVWSPRPQIFSLLCFAILFRFVKKFDDSLKKKYLVYIIILFLFWSNLHAGFTLGIAFLTLFVLGKIFDFSESKQRTEVESKKIKYLLFLILICSLVVIINPNGIETWKVQFDTVSMKSLQNQIDEWASPDFHKLEQQPFLWIWLIITFFAFSTSSNLLFQEILPIIFFGSLGFIAKRNFAPFAIVVFPTLAKLTLLFFEQKIRNVRFFDKLKLSANKANLTPKQNIQIIINLFFVSIIGLAIFGKIFVLSNTLVLKSYEKKLFPADAMDYLTENGLPDGNVLNSYAWGGYMNWKIPELLVFVDGRTDLFGEKIIRDWTAMVSAKSGYDRLINEYNIKWIFLENDNPIVEELIQKGWATNFKDDLCVILSK